MYNEKIKLVNNKGCKGTPRIDDSYRLSIAHSLLALVFYYFFLMLML